VDPSDPVRAWGVDGVRPYSFCLLFCSLFRVPYEIFIPFFPLPDRVA